MIELSSNRYGKAAIRLVRVVRDPAGHRVRDLTVAIALEGDFEAAHTDGENANVVATDTMKNTAYAFAKDHLDGSIEAYDANTGAVAHSFTVDSPSVSVDVPAGESRSVTFTAPASGGMAFYCRFHPGMQGTITLATTSPGSWARASSSRSSARRPGSIATSSTSSRRRSIT